MTQNPRASSALKDESSTVTLRYQLIRNVTSPDEQKSGKQSFVVNLPAEEILGLDTRGNLRSYIAEYNPRKRNRVHEAIAETIEFAPERFITRNGGFVISAAGIQVDDKTRTVMLTDANIINGAQSQGEIRRFFQPFLDDTEELPILFHVRAEIIVDPDPVEVVETAIARNTATPVKSISQAGARGHLDELERRLAGAFPGEKLMKSETDVGGIDPIRVLQFSRLLMPSSISGSSSAAETLRPYKNPAQCLSDFSEWYGDWKAQKDGVELTPERQANAVKYEFTVSIAPEALSEFRYWNSHEGWNGHRLWDETKKGGRAYRRDPKSKKIIWVAPGVLFPLIGAMSEFVEEDNGAWRISKPTSFKPEDMIAATVKQFRGYNSDPMYMGRSDAAYEALRIYPRTLMEVLRFIKEGN